MNNKLIKNKRLKPLANSLRKNATKEENKLWYQYLRTFPVKFHRQRVIGNYITDFFCPKAKLVIELDGSQHFEEKAHKKDLDRTDFLYSLGIKVIRFTNLEVNTQFEAVCLSIQNEVNNRIK